MKIQPTENKQTKPEPELIIFVEGETDEKYIKKAIEVFNFQHLVDVRWIGIKDRNGNTLNSGTPALNDFWLMHIRNPNSLKRPTLLLYDCDAKKISENREDIFIRTIPRNSKNSLYKRGIENLLNLQKDFKKDKFYVKKKSENTTDEYGAPKKLEQYRLDKTGLCNWLCGEISINKQQKYLSNFSLIFDIINELFLLIKKNRKSKKFDKPIFDISDIQSLDSFPISYINDREHIELILKRKEPSKYEVPIVLYLIEQNINYKNYFFEEVSDILWFSALKEQNYFSFNSATKVIKIDNTIQIPWWQPSTYLERITENISLEKDKDIIVEILEIIKKITNSEIDNSRIWISLVRITLNLPKEVISEGIINLIPNWLEKSKSYNQDNSYISSQICNNLLRKFLNKDSSDDDIQKSELILKHIFTTEKESNQAIEKYGFYSISNKLIIYKHWVITHIINNNEILDLIATKCSIDTITNLAIKLKEILFNFNKTHTYYLHIDEKEFALKISIINKDLEIELSENKDKLETVILSNFETTEESQIYKTIEDLLKKYIKSKLSEDIKKTIYDISNFEHFDDTPIWLKYISKISKNAVYMNKAEEIIVLALRNFILAKAKHSDITNILNDFLVKDKYRLPIFKRLALYIITKNWDVYKALFWNVFDNELIPNLFFRHRFHNELYFLLKENVGKFSQEEKERIQNVINKEEKDYNQLRWYTALKEDLLFKDNYIELSSKLDTKEDAYERLGEAQFFSGENTPLSIDEIAKMSVEEIVKYTFKFTPTDEPGTPSHTGLAKAIRDTVIKQPNKFLTETKTLTKLPYFYTYYILEGFIDAWKNEEDINWNELLEFCQLYINQNGFGEEQEKLIRTSWHISSDYILGTISRLITAGTQNDKNAFELKLLAKAKIILDKIVNIISNTIDSDFRGRNLLEYTLNSVGGKTTFAYLNYLLRKARTEYSPSDKIKWNKEDKSGFTALFRKDIIDVHIQFGEYLSNYFYIDKQWCYEQLANYTQTNPASEYFLSGYMYSNPYNEERLFLSLKPLLKNYIQTNKEWLEQESPALVKHLVIYYLWHEGNLNEKDSLINIFLNNSKTQHITKLIEFISHERKNILSLETKKEHTDKIIALWQKLSSRKKDYKLYTLVKYIDKVNYQNLNLIKKAVQNSEGYYLEEIFKHLNKLKDKNTTKKEASYMAEVLDSLPIPEWVDEKEVSIYALIEYLYKFKSNEEIFRIANDFCNKYAEKGYSFLTELYRKNQE